MKTINTPVPIKFYDKTIFMLVHNGKPFVPMKPIVENMGLDWHSQYRKITTSRRYSHMTIPLETPGGVQEMLCVPLNKVNGWLYSVNPEKVKPELKETIIRYQEESTRVLYEYWNNGHARNPRKNETGGFFEKKSKEFIALKKLARAKGFDEIDSIEFAATKMKKRYGDMDNLFGTSHLYPPLD